MNKIYFERILIIGMGLIGSSLARAVKKNNLSSKIFGLDNDRNVINKCKKLKILTDYGTSINNFNKQFDLIIICTPLSTYSKIFNYLNKYINQYTIVTDVGSTKASVIEDYKNFCNNKNIFFVPSHPIAGLEKSGPEYGFAELFENRYCILTPIKKENKFFKQIKIFWKSIGMRVEIMEAYHHDRVLALTSHIPQLVAYSIVATATELESKMKEEIIKYSAAGFRDFTRLAGSDPIMWRDVYNKNKDSVLEMLGRFTEELTTLQKAIRNNDNKLLEDTFSSTKNIRKMIEELGQAGTFDPREKQRSKLKKGRLLK